jgi:nitrous oxide reductase accessory protein NosL
MAMMVTISVCTITLLGCTTKSGLPTIVTDRTACSNCKMLVSETAYAAAFRVGDEDKVFDDIGCMLDKLGSDPILKPDQIWVRDLKSDTWIDAKASFFAFSKEQRTPMGSGYVAFRHRSEAESAASKATGKVLNGLDVLLVHYLNNDHAQN